VSNLHAGSFHLQHTIAGFPNFTRRVRFWAAKILLRYIKKKMRTDLKLTYYCLMEICLCPCCDIVFSVATYISRMHAGKETGLSD
jgi:hypothetical protein